MWSHFVLSALVAVAVAGNAETRWDPDRRLTRGRGAQASINFDRRQLTSNGANLHPTWTRDGSRIVFTSGRSGRPELWVMNGDGSDPQQLTADTHGANVSPDVSHDGTRIAFTSMRPQVVPEVWVMNADGGDAQRLTVTPLNPSPFNWSL